MKTREQYSVDQLKQALEMCFHLQQYSLSEVNIL